MAQYRNGKTVAWTALLIALVALVIAVLAFNRSGQNIQEAVSEEMDDAAIEMRADLQATEEELLGEDDETDTATSGTDTPPADDTAE